MKCFKKNNTCKPQLQFLAEGDNFICSGISKKPTSYKKDVVWMCLKGATCKSSLEMTLGEAASVVAVLSSAIASVRE